ncbi:MAG: HD domain-containing protein [Candidatus Heimdallarchaeaceae archaeon]
MKNRKVQLKYVKNLQELEKVVSNAFMFVKEQFEKYEKKKSHSLEHTIRVTRLCLELAKRIGGNLDILLVAALFHDVGRPIESITGECHAEIGSKIVETYLDENSLSQMFEEVRDAILYHRFSKGIEPKTKEGKILKDADSLDALGSMGIYRTITYNLEKGYDLEKTIEHFYEKLFKLPQLMRFPITKQIAEEKSKIMKQFVKEILIAKEKSKIENLEKFLHEEISVEKPEF